MRFDITELKILSGAVLGSVIAPIDMIARFVIPILSALVWFFLKPVLVNWTKKRALKKKLKN
jgi:hypothetical protein